MSPWLWPPSEKPLTITPRELQVLVGASEGHTNVMIGHDLGISEQTVKNHITRINQRLGTQDRTTAVVYAIRAGWIRL